MRLLFFNTSFPPQARSAARLFFDLGSYLVECGHEVSVVTEMPWRRLGAGEQNQPIQRREAMSGMQVIRVAGYRFHEASMLGRGINLLLLPFSFYRAARSLGEHDVALVYSPPLSLGLAAFLLKSLHRLPFIFNVQDIYPQTAIDLGYMKSRLLVRFFEAMEKFVYRHAAKLVVHSDGNRHFLVAQKSVSPDRVVTIPNWIDTDKIVPGERMNSFRARHNIGNKFLVTYAGTMGYGQDLNPIIECASTLRDYEDILFLLVGEGVREAEWREKTRHLSNVRMLPLQPQPEYHLLVAATDLGLVPLIENLHTPVVPGKLLDFMAGARPVIATVHLGGDTATIIREAHCGFALSPLDPAGVAAALLALYRDPAMGRELGMNGRKHAEARFSLRAGAEAYENLFRALLKQPAPEYQKPSSAFL